MSYTSCKNCGACCIAPSISSALPGMPRGKAAGVRCINLDTDNTCRAYDARPPVCRDFSPTEEICGNGFHDAMDGLRLLEIQTAQGHSCNN